MALRGLRVLEMAGLAPVPFAGMVLAGTTVSNKTAAFVVDASLILCRFRCLQTLERLLSE